MYKIHLVKTGKTAISPFPTLFSTRLDNSSNLKMSSANSFSFEESKICRLVTVLKGYGTYYVISLEVLCVLNFACMNYFCLFCLCFSSCFSRSKPFIEVLFVHFYESQAKTLLTHYQTTNFRLFPIERI